MSEADTYLGHKPEVITIEPVQNGVLFDACGRRMVYELRPGNRTQAVRDLLTAVAGELGAGLDVRIEIRDPRGEEQPLHATPVKWSLTPEDVEAEYSISARTLEVWRASAKGPPYIKPGKRVLYLRDDIEAFLRANAIKTTGKS